MLLEISAYTAVSVSAIFYFLCFNLRSTLTQTYKTNCCKCTLFTYLVPFIITSFVAMRYLFFSDFLLPFEIVFIVSLSTNVEMAVFLRITRWWRLQIATHCVYTLCYFLHFACLPFCTKKIVYKSLKEILTFLQIVGFSYISSDYYLRIKEMAALKCN